MYSLSSIKHILKSTDSVIGNAEVNFSRLGDTNNVDEDTLDWIHSTNSDPFTYYQQSKAKIIIVPRSLEDRIHSANTDKTSIVTDNPMLLFARIARELFVDKPVPGIHPSAVIHPQARVGKDVYIGPLCYIGKCEIGDKCIIHSHVSIEDNVKIGANVLIKNGARIGQPGFGFVKNEVDDYEKFPQIGSVIIEDNVEIGANSCIDRGALSITRIGRGTKIDNMVQVAHNVQIGENCLIAGYAGLGGSSQIGNNVWIGPKSSIKFGVTVGDGAFINTGSVVINNVKPREDVIGYPAESKAMFIRKKRELFRLCKERKK